MVHFLIALVVILPIIILTFELAAYATYGGFVKSKDVIKAIDFHLPNGAELNMFDTNIIQIGNMPCISTSKSVLGIYYISGVGRVWTFSPAHKRISKIHDALLSEIPKTTIEEKLKIK